MIDWDLHLAHCFDELWSMIRVCLSDLLGADELFDSPHYIILCHSIGRRITYHSCKTISDDQHPFLQDQHIIMDFGCANGIKGDEIAALLEFSFVCDES